MGASNSKNNSKKKPFTILLHGLDSEGKTNLWYALQPREIKTTIEKTTGINIEKINVTLPNTELLQILDIGGRCSIRPLFRYHYRYTDGFVYVIDSNDKKRLDESIAELNRFIFQEDVTQNKVILVLANQQDKATALPVETIEERIREKISLNEPTLGGRSVFVKGCSVTTKEGLCEAFSIFVERIILKKAERSLGYPKIESTLKEIDSDRKSNYQARNGKNESYFYTLMKLFDNSFLKCKSVLTH